MQLFLWIYFLFLHLVLSGNSSNQQQILFMNLTSGVICFTLSEGDISLPEEDFRPSTTIELILNVAYATAVTEAGSVVINVNSTLDGRQYLRYEHHISNMSHDLHVWLNEEEVEFIKERSPRWYYMSKFLDVLVISDGPIDFTCSGNHITDSIFHEEINLSESHPNYDSESVEIVDSETNIEEVNVTIIDNDHFGTENLTTNALAEILFRNNSEYVGMARIETETEELANISTTKFVESDLSDVEKELTTPSVSTFEVIDNIQNYSSEINITTEKLSFPEADDVEMTRSDIIQIEESVMETEPVNIQSTTPYIQLPKEYIAKNDSLISTIVETIEVPSHPKAAFQSSTTETNQLLGLTSTEGYSTSIRTHTAVTEPPRITDGPYINVEPHDGTFYNTPNTPISVGSIDSSAANGNEDEEDEPKEGNRKGNPTLIYVLTFVLGGLFVAAVTISVVFHRKKKLLIMEMAVKPTKNERRINPGETQQFVKFSNQV